MKKSFGFILVLALMCTLSFSVFAVELTDVDGHWASKQIGRWTDEQVITGYTNGTFLPDNHVSRAEFVTMDTRLFEFEQKVDLKNFTDVDEAAWFYDAMSRAVAAGAINGYNDLTLRPNAKLSRQETMVILNRIVKLKRIGNTDVLEAFTDGNEVADWAKEDVSIFVERGFVNGYTDGTIRPTALITRAEIAKILDELVGLIVKTKGTVDLTGVTGIVIVKSENVTLTNADKVDKIIVLNEDVKKTLKIEGTYPEENIIVLNAGSGNSGTTSSGEKTDSGETTPPKKTSSGGGGSSVPASKVAVITLTTTSGESGEEFYNVEKNDVEINEDNRITIVVDGKKLIDEVKIGLYGDLKNALIKAIKDDTLDEEKVIRTIEKKYSNVSKLRDWGRKTFGKLSEEDQDKAQELVDNAPVSFIEVYEALGLEKNEIKELAISVVDEFTKSDVIETLKKI